MRFLIVDALSVTSINAKRLDENEIWAYRACALRRNSQLRKAFVATLDEFFSSLNGYNSLLRAPYSSKNF